MHGVKKFFAALLAAIFVHSAAATNAPPASVAVGQTMSEVKAALGKPSGTMAMKGKTVWVYNQGDVVFDLSNRVESCDFISFVDYMNKVAKQEEYDAAAAKREASTPPVAQRATPAASASAEPAAAPTAETTASAELTATSQRREVLDQYARAGTGKIYLLVKATIKNTGASSYAVYDGSFSIRDHAGKTYPVARTERGRFGGLDLAPGNTSEGVLCYEIPKEAYGFALVFAGRQFTAETVIK